MTEGDFVVIFSKSFAALTVTVTLAATSGCFAPLISNLMHVTGADMIKPEYAGLNEQTVAIVTQTEHTAFGVDPVAALLSRKVGQRLLAGGKEIVLVRDQKIDVWRDANGYDSGDLVAMGKEVEADKVVQIVLDDLRLRDGATLYRGRANATITVYDVATGTEVYRRDVDEFTFPTSAGMYTSETTEARFTKLYLSQLATHIGRLFHPYDFSDTIAADGIIASQ